MNVPSEATEVLQHLGDAFAARPSNRETAAALWTGRWKIVSGTDGLADVHGRGYFEGPSFHLTYEGSVRL